MSHLNKKIIIKFAFLTAFCLLFSFSFQLVSAEEITGDSPEIILGCTDELAENYNLEATEDNGSCVYPEPETVLGCTDELAENYNLEATEDNGSCVYPEPEAVFGCIDETADNYNAEATEDDGSCVYPEPEAVLGCTDETAENYNLEADEDDGSCVYLSSEALAEEEPEPEAVFGCMDETANNYNIEVTEDDGSCIYSEPEPGPEPKEPTCQPAEEVCDGIDNDCDGLIDENNICWSPETKPLPANLPAKAPSGAKEGAPEPIPDPATAPSAVTIKVLMPGGNPPPFPVFVTFVGVGNKNFGGEIDANGELSVIMPQGRYYTELMVINTEYVQGEDGPSFFLESNEERNLGLISLISKSEQDKIGQSLEDQSLEANILSEAESAKGVGKILVLIVKLLMKILEEIRVIASQLAGK